MKIAATIFIILGMVFNFIFANWILGIIGIIFGAWALGTLSENKKSVACGILCVFFTGLLGGIFYLCWNGEENK